MFDTYSSPYAPLEGTLHAPRAMFIDRWGTLLEVPEGGLARSPSDVRFFPDALQTLFLANRAGWYLYLLGNETSVIEGDVSQERWKEIEEALIGQLSKAGIPIRKNYASVKNPEGIDGHRLDSVYLLPNTGAFYHAAHNDGVDLRESWVIGDSTLELVAVWRAGCRQMGVRSGQAVKDGAFRIEPDLMEENLVAAVRELLTREKALHP
jgi:histidinol phosphatase-like enzyme